MKIREFLRLRRQQDAVKIIILYVIAIGVCCGFLIRDGLRYAQIIRTKEEFKLIGNDQVLTDSKVQRVREIEGVTDVSYDVSDSVTVSYQANTTSFEAELLSEAYIQEVYGITQEGSTMTYYANNAAYKQICQSLSQDIAPIQTEELTVTYTSSTEQSQNANQPTDSGNDASQAGDSRFVHKLLCLQLRVFALLHCLPHIFMKIIDDLMSFFEICLGILELSLICTADY